MNKVYAWYPAATTDGLNIGHASLDISFGMGRGRAEYERADKNWRAD